MLALVRPDETALELFASLRSHAIECGLPFLAAALPSGRLLPGELVEVHGPSGAGKSALLCAAASHAATMPASERSSTDVVYLDLDGRVPLHRIVAGVQRALGGAEADEQCVSACCERVAIARCVDSMQLLATLAQVRARARALTGGRSLLVIVDGLSSRFWLDKAEAGGSTNPYERAASSLAELLRTRRAAVLVGTAAVIESGARDGASVALARLAKARVVLQPLPTRPPAAAAAGADGHGPSEEGASVAFTVSHAIGGAAAASGRLRIDEGGVCAMGNG